MIQTQHAWYNASDSIVAMKSYLPLKCVQLDITILHKIIQRMANTVILSHMWQLKDSQSEFRAMIIELEQRRKDNRGGIRGTKCTDWSHRFYIAQKSSHNTALNDKY